MSVLSEKMRRARQVRVESNGRVFVVLRPTPLQWEQIIKSDDVAQGVISLVIGWEKFVELDLIPGGDPHPVPFDADACAEWLADHPADFTAVSEAVLAAMQSYYEGMRGEVKN